MKNLPKFNNQKLFNQAFTHRSYLNEVKSINKSGGEPINKKIDSNERLEFLGDSILSFVVSAHLFKNYSQFDEGTLTWTLTKDTVFPKGDWRSTYFVPENLNSSVEHADALKPIIPKNMTMAEMALRFIL